MKAQFMPMQVNRQIMESLQDANQEQVCLLINEIDRLESIVKNYEVAMNQVTHAIDSTTFKEYGK